MNHKTQVTVKQTAIKMIDESTNEVTIGRVNGKMNITESKQYAHDRGLTYISKEDTKDVFYVDTNQLKQLREK